MEAHASFPAELASATAARRFVERTLADWRCDTLVEDARLLVSELVINAVMHAGTPIEVDLLFDDGMLRVEVRDESHRPPVVRPLSTSSPTGRGLVIVDALADRWGFETDADHKVVWFEISPVSRGREGALTTAESPP